MQRPASWWPSPGPSPPPVSREKEYIRAPLLLSSAHDHRGAPAHGMPRSVQFAFDVWFRVPGLIPFARARRRAFGRNDPQCCCVCVCVCVCFGVHAYSCVLARTPRRMYVWLYVCMHTCMYIDIYIHIYTCLPPPECRAACDGNCCTAPWDALPSLPPGTSTRM